jgi:hypothetical protein
MALAPSKNKKKTPKFVRAVDDNVYLFEQGKGGIITPAYEEITPLLGEYDEGWDMPPALQDWLKGYAAEMEWYANDSLMEDEPQDIGGADEPRKNIPYMCKASWGQGAPYNDLLDFGWGVCKTGCWATAVGIIMRYWASKGYHRGCLPTTPYWYKRHPKEFDPLPGKIVFDYRNIVDKPTTAAQKKAVAEMLKYIGMACKVNYGVDGTGVSATLAAPLLKERLRMGNNIKSVEGSDAWMEKTLYNELAAGRPVIIRGANSSNSGGHFFIADGYRAKDSKYHINWGWNGYYNGYYAWTALTPAQGLDYTYYRVLTIGIQPDYYLGDVNGDGRVNITDVMVLLERIQQGDTSIIGDVNSDGMVSADDWMLIIDAILGKKML